MMAGRAIQYRYLGFISLVLGFAVVHWLKPVLLPLVIALFMIAVAMPITTWLNRIFPKHISYVLSYVALITILGLFTGITYLSIAEFTNELPQYEEQFFFLLQEMSALLRGYGLPAPRELNAEQLQQFFPSLVSTFYATLGHIVLIVALVLLGLPELVFWEDKLKNCLGKTSGGKWRTAASEAAISFQKYMTVMTVIGFVSAILTTSFAWAFGLDFALLWGVLAFIMNFIPVLGAILAVLPPIFVAMMQFTDPADIWVITIGLGSIQFFIGNVIDPKFQGKFLSMSPVVILLSISFWTFLWGAPGAFLAVPLTHIFMVAGFQFPNTKHIACLLSDGKGVCAKS
jgi:predicted PurR-regulated permease PerM